MQKLGTLLFMMVLFWLGQGVAGAQKAQADLPATWTDTTTALMWTAKDNGSDVTWQQAVSYCQNLNLGGYSDWRLPEIGELQNIYDSAAKVPGHWQDEVTVQFQIKGNLMLTGWHWSNTQSNISGKAWTFDFFMNSKDPAHLDENRYGRALCVRRAVIVNPAEQNVEKVPLAEKLDTWTDPGTGLMWTRQDNGSDVVWQQAANYCQNLSLGGYFGWRLATIDELHGTYDPSTDVPGSLENRTATHHVKGHLMLSAAQWSSFQGSASREVWIFNFLNRKRYHIPLAASKYTRALCVHRP
jgi:hypothetical protein